MVKMDEMNAIAIANECETLKEFIEKLEEILE